MDETPKERQLRPREVSRYAAFAVLIGLLIAFIVDNTQSVRVGFVFFDRRASLIWVLIVTAIVGAALDRLIQWRRNR